MTPLEDDQEAGLDKLDEEFSAWKNKPFLYSEILSLCETHTSF